MRTVYGQDGAAAVEDTGQLTILIDDNQVSEVSSYTLRDDPLESQTSSVIHMSIWDDGGQLVTKLHRSLKDTHKRNMWVKNKNGGVTEKLTVLNLH